MKRHLLYLLPLFLVLAVSPRVLAQNELAATLEVLAVGVDVQRVNTINWIPVKVEAIVGVGDSIRTDTTGKARITFFADGTDTELLPNTTYRIQRFEGDETQFNITVEVVAGQTVQRLARLLDANSSYDVTTPGIEMAARGTQFAIRVEDNGRSAMLVTEGNVDASAQEKSAEVPPGFGVRAAVEEVLSDVVPARTFEELDTAIDGCDASVTTDDDVRINVRVGASRDFQRIGTIDATEINHFYGVTQSGDWYRIPFRGGYGWILSSKATLKEGCIGLRPFADNFGPEDAALYSSIGDSIELESIEATPEPAPIAESTPAE